MTLEPEISAMLAEQERPPLLPKVETFVDRASAEFEAVLLDLARAIAMKDEAAHARAKARVQAYLAGVLILANLTGRRSILLQSDRAARGSVNASVRLSIPADPRKEDKWFAGDVPRVEFREAIDDILEREPRLLGYWDKVGEVYATRHAFALTGVTDYRVTRRVQEEVARFMREGTAGPIDYRDRLREVLEGVQGYSTAYAQTVFRTNAWTAFTAGQFQQLDDPDVAEVLPALEFNATMDGDTRPNHAAAHGLVAPPSDQIWNRLSPPLGFNCRCDIVPLTVQELRSQGLVDPGGTFRPRYPLSLRNAYPDPGFGLGRPGHGLPVGA